MPGLVYLLCALTSLACCAMLARGYRQTRVRLLLWSALCFAGLTIDNIVLYIDVIVVPHIDLTILRRLPGFIGIALLNFGLIWDSK
jgi:hypothetical protein